MEKRKTDIPNDEYLEQLNKDFIEHLSTSELV